jgi:hypothetical protein
VPIGCLNPREHPGNARESQNDNHAREPVCLQGISMPDGKHTFCLPCRRSRVRIPSAALEKACVCRPFSWAQSAGASASPDNDWTSVSVATRIRDRKGLSSRRFRATSTLELLCPAADWESTAPVRCPAAPAPLRFVRGRSAAFVEEQHSQPALLRVVHRDSAAAVAVARLLLPRERKPLRVGVDPPDPRPRRRQVVAARRRGARPPHDALTRAAGAG